MNRPKGRFELKHDLTGHFRTKRLEKTTLEKSLNEAEGKVQCGTECAAASPD